LLTGFLDYKDCRKPESYMKLTVKMIDIATREVLLNFDDARNIGVLAGDRVQILNQSNGVSVAAFVDTTTSIIPRGTVGIYRITNERLNVSEGTAVEVRMADRPASLQYIRKKIDGSRF
jgi:AMP phosphorylase